MELALVVQTLDSAIHWIKNLSLILIHLIVIYPVDSAIQCLNNQGLVDCLHIIIL